MFKFSTLKIYVSCLSISILFISFSALSKNSISYSNQTPIQLYEDNGKLSASYNQKIKFLSSYFKGNSEPLKVQFSQGLEFTVYNIFEGGQNLLLDIGDGKLLRIRNFGINNWGLLKYYLTLDLRNIIDPLDIFKNGYDFLKAHGVPIPKVETLPTHKKEFLIIEKLDIYFFYSDYKNPNFENSVSKEYLEKVDTDLLRFVRRTAGLSIIGDFKSSNIAYTNKGWVLIDFTNNSEVAYGKESSNIFERSVIDDAINRDILNSVVRTREFVAKPGFPERIKHQAQEVIRAERNYLFSQFQDITSKNLNKLSCYYFFI